MTERERQDRHDRGPIDTDQLNAGIERGEGIGVTGAAGFGGSNQGGETAGATGGPETGADIMTGGGAGLGGSEIAGGTGGAGATWDNAEDALLDAGVDPTSASDLVLSEEGTGGTHEGAEAGGGGRPAGGADWAGTSRAGQVGESGILDLDMPDRPTGG